MPSQSTGQILSIILLASSFAACTSSGDETSQTPNPLPDAATDVRQDVTADVAPDATADHEVDATPGCAVDPQVSGPTRVEISSDVVFQLPSDELNVFVRPGGTKKPFTKLTRASDGTATYSHADLTFGGIDYYFSLKMGSCEATKPATDPTSKPLHVRVYGEKNLTDDPTLRSEHPHVFDHWVVYDTDMGGQTGQDIEMFDLYTFEKRTIVSKPAAQREPRVSARWIAWIDERNKDTSKLDIFGLDRKDNTEHALITEPHTQYGLELSGHVMVWQDYRAGSGSNGDIYLYDLGADGAFGTPDDPGEHVITNNPADQSFPEVSVHADGQITVVWEDMRDDVDGQCTMDNCDTNIYVAGSGPDGVFGTSDDRAPQAVTKNGARQNGPVVSERWIVWRDWRDATQDDDPWGLYAYDMGADGVFGTTDDGGLQKIAVGAFVEPGSLDLDGSRLVYTDRRGISQEVFLFDLDSKLEKPITAAKGIQGACAISGKTIVWRDGRNNTMGKHTEDIWVDVLP